MGTIDLANTLMKLAIIFEFQPIGCPLLLILIASFSSIIFNVESYGNLAFIFITFVKEFS